MTGTKDPGHAGPRVEHLLEAVLAIGSDLDLKHVLQRIVEAATSLVHARFGALGVLSLDGKELAQFITVGVDDETAARIGPRPHGHGVLGQIITDPRPLRLTDLAEHRASFGLPANHPPMHSFLGVPVRVGDEVFGNLYLTEKEDGSRFTDEDEAILIALAAAAGVAVQNARRYDETRRRSAWMEAGREVFTALLSGSESRDVLGLAAALAHSVTDADGTFFALDSPEGLHVAASSGLREHDPLKALPVDVLARAQESSALQVDLPEGQATVVPVGRRGVLVCVWTAPAALDGTDDLADFAQQCAVALELADRRREAERFAVIEDRDRIARDLHDLVIQRLFATGMQLQSAVRLLEQDPAEAAARVNRAVDDLDGTIRELRSTIYGLQTPMDARPSLRSQILEVVEDATRQLGYAPSLRLEGLLDTLATQEVADHVLASLREALSNAARHASASKVDVLVSLRGKVFTVKVQDDGKGMAEDSARSGLLNLAHRAELAGGNLRVTSSPAGGTTLLWQAPV